MVSDTGLSASLPASGSRKWFMPPMPETRSWMQAATQDPSTVVSMMSLPVK